MVIDISARNAVYSLALIISLATVAHAKNLHPEKWYQEKWCKAQNGIVEYVLPDKTRVDCLTAEYAVEADFAKKWAESVGQALYYGYVTGKKPGVLLIMEKETDTRYLKRLQTVAEKEGIKIWLITP